jgi:hypothetical protein
MSCTRDAVVLFVAASRRTFSAQEILLVVAGIAVWVAVHVCCEHALLTCHWHVHVHVACILCGALALSRLFLPCVSCLGVPLQVPPWQVSHLLCRASALLCICMWSGGLCPGLALGAASSVAFTGHVLCPGTGPKVTLSQRNCWLGVCTCKYNE